MGFLSLLPKSALRFCRASGQSLALASKQFGMMTAVLPVLLSLCFPNGLRAAENPTGWSDPIILSEKVESRASFDPRLSSDLNDHLHVVWRGWAGPNYPGPEASNVLFYAQWDGVVWSDPVDVISTAASQSDVWAGSVVVTSQGRVAVTWASPVTVSWAPLGKANDARQWTSVTIDSGRYPRMTVDPTTNRWYVIYVSELWSIAITYSDDEGASWSTPSIIWEAQGANSAAAYPSLAISANGSLHAVWSEHTEDAAWGGRAIWYASKGPGEDEYSVRMVVRQEPGETTVDHPALVATNLGDILMFWNNGAGSTTGRFYQWSKDNGETWTPTLNAFPGLSGQTQQAALAADSAGQIHVVTAANGDGYGYGVLRYATFVGGRWSSYITLWPEPEAERPAMVVSGSRLRLVWLKAVHQDAGKWEDFDGQIGYSSLPIDEPKEHVARPLVSPQPATTPEVLAVAGLAATPSPTSFAGNGGTKPSDQFDGNGRRADNPNSRYSAIVAGVLPAIVLLLAVIVTKVARSRH